MVTLLIYKDKLMKKKTRTQQIKFKSQKYSFKQSIPIYLMLLPGLIYLLINNYLPMAGIVLAFKKMNYRLGIFRSPWTGFDNFEFLFASGNVSVIIRNTLLYNLVFIVLSIVIPITVAILLNEIKSKPAKKIYQTSILLPFLMSYVIVSYLVFAFLSADAGYVNNSILPALGIEKTISFYQEKVYWPFILTFVHMWKGLGFSTVIYLAALLGINPDVYEAARIDGAGKWNQIKNITIPSLLPTIITLFILSVGKIFYSDFGLFFQVPKNSGALFGVTQTIDTYVYNALMVQNSVSLSSAAGVIQSVCGFFLIILANFIIKKISEENAMF